MSDDRAHLDALDAYWNAFARNVVAIESDLDSDLAATIRRFHALGDHDAESRPQPGFLRELRPIVTTDPPAGSDACTDAAISPRVTPVNGTTISYRSTRHDAGRLLFHRWSVLAGAAVLALLLGIAWRLFTPQATGDRPAQIPAIGYAATPASSNAGCDVQPRSSANLVSFLDNATGAEPTPPTTVPIENRPAGTAAIDRTTVRQVQTTVEEAVACLARGDVPRSLALYSDDFIAHELAPVAAWRVTQPNWAGQVLTAYQLALISTALPSIPTYVDGWMLDDGRLQIIFSDPAVAGVLNHPETTRMIFANVDGHWLIDAADIQESGRPTEKISPDECTVAPISADEIDRWRELVAAITPVASPSEPTFPRFDVPNGVPASDTEWAAANRTMRQFAACNNTGDALRALAIFSQGYLERRIPQTADPASKATAIADLDNFPTAPTPIPAADWRSMPLLLHVVHLADGRIGVYFSEIGDLSAAGFDYVSPFPTTGIVFCSLVPASDRYLIDSCEPIDRPVGGADASNSSDFASPTPSAFSPTHRSRADARVNLRSDPSFDNDPIDVLDPGTPVQFLGQTRVDDGGNFWYRVRTEDGQTGWLRAEAFASLSNGVDVLCGHSYSSWGAATTNDVRVSVLNVEQVEEGKRPDGTSIMAVDVAVEVENRGAGPVAIEPNDILVSGCNGPATPDAADPLSDSTTLEPPEAAGVLGPGESRTFAVVGHVVALPANRIGRLTFLVEANGTRVGAIDCPLADASLAPEAKSSVGCSATSDRS
ncbi:MAG TPA: SH3 domain-containing protein [Thermomicrobiales bacterium]